MRISAHGAALAALSMCMGCAPSLQSLVRDREYNEAICAVTVFGHDAGDKQMVLSSLRSDADSSIHVQAVTLSQLRTVMGDRADAMHRKFLFLRVLTDANELSVNESVTGVTVEDDGEPVEQLQSTREIMAEAMGEHLPQRVTTTTRPSFLDKAAGALANGPYGLGLATGEALLLGSIPLMEIGGVVPKTTSTTSFPTEDDYRRQAPTTQALHEAKVAVYRRPRTDNVRLVLHQAWASWSYRGPCVIDDTAVVTLAAGNSPEERINARFGERMLRVRELR